MVQGAYQIVGWCISVAIGAGAGFLIGLLYKALNGLFEDPKMQFSDEALYQGLNAKE